MLFVSQPSTVLPGGRPYTPSQCWPENGSSVRMDFHVRPSAGLGGFLISSRYVSARVRVDGSGEHDKKS